MLPFMVNKDVYIESIPLLTLMSWGRCRQPTLPRCPGTGVEGRPGVGHTGRPAGGRTLPNDRWRCQPAQCQSETKCATPLHDRGTAATGQNGHPTYHFSDVSTDSSSTHSNPVSISYNALNRYRKLAG